jgi:uncharacterized membrane protein YcfT
MQRIVHSLALGAALIALVASLWHDWGTFTTVKRMVIAYLGFFFVGAVLSLAVKLVGVLEKDHPATAEKTGKETPKA